MSTSAPSSQSAAARLRWEASFADARRVADDMGALWDRIDLTLSPVLGHRGVAGLYRRSVQLTVPAHPWLAPTIVVTEPTLNLDALRHAIAQQPSGQAASGAGALLGAFESLLASLIGAALADRLLAPAWADFFGGVPAGKPSI